MPESGTAGIWIWVGCNTCSTQCPNCIDIPAVSDALRQKAMAEGVVVAEPMAGFHVTWWTPNRYSRH